MLEKMRETRLGRWVSTGAVGAALVAPAAGATAAAADTRAQPNDRYERVQLARASGVATAHAARSPKTGPAAANTVNRVAKRLRHRGYDIECRVSTTRLGAIGVIECKGSQRAKRELARQIRRLVREDKIIAPEASGYYSGFWTTESTKEVRIDWASFGYFGIPA